MPSINLIRGSDGNGNASVATVQATRSPMATTIQVNTTTNWPTTFMATMGTPHTFVDPVTGEQITVISEATAVDFKGHLDGGNIEIDSIAPGYTDLGSQTGDIVIIKPTTEWANNVADTLAVVHEDDGTLKDDVVDTDAVQDDAITTPKIDDEAITNAKLATGAGEPGGAWDSWTPTLTNLSGGTITRAAYKLVGKTVFFHFIYTLAGAGVAGIVGFSLPVAGNSGFGSSPIGNARLIDANGSTYQAIPLFSLDTCVVNVMNVSSTYPTIVALSPTIPFTWASGDSIHVTGVYEAA